MIDFKSPRTPYAIAYACRQIADRAGVVAGDPDGKGFDALDLSIAYSPLGHPDSANADIIIVPCADDSWHDLLGRDPHSLDWIGPEQVVPSGARLAFQDPIPVLFWGDGFEGKGKPFAEMRDDGAIVFYADIIAAVLFMLSRWEETVVRDCDEHDRFPGSSSVACKQGFLDRPIVDEYGLILREWLKIVRPGWEPKPRSFSVKLSHDIDKVRRLSDWQTAIRAIAGDLIRRRSPKNALRNALAAVCPRRDPYFQGIHQLARISHEAGLGNDAFHFMANNGGAYGSDYDIGSRLVRGCISDLAQQGFEIGLHASYEAYNDPERLAKEKAVFDAIIGSAGYGSSQHYLRSRVPDTWRHWEQLGSALTSTMTYPDQEGFRCGTCHPFHPFDLEMNRELKVQELPIIVMDVTLLHYRELSPSEGEARILALARRCKQVEGVFTLLWHNSSLDGAWASWGSMYRRAVVSLSELVQ
jgi:hypothetical protein